MELQNSDRLQTDYCFLATNGEILRKGVQYLVLIDWI